MNIYYCDTCGARIPDSETNESAGAHFCSKHQPAVEKIPVASRASSSKSKLIPAARRSDTAHLPLSPGSKKSGSAIVLAGAAALLCAVVIALFAFGGRTTSTQSSEPPRLSETPKPQQKAAELKPLPPPPPENPQTVVSNPLPAPRQEDTDLVEIRESAARHKLDEIVAYEKSDRAEPYNVRKRYLDFVSSSFKGTRAATEAQVHLKDLPVVDPPKVTATTDGLILHFNFAEGSGETAADCSGHGSNGTLKNATWTSGKGGGALEFSDKESYVNVEESRDMGSSYTIAAWVRAGHRSTAQSIMTRRHKTIGKLLGYMIRIAPEGNVAAGYRTGEGSDGVWANSQTKVDDNKWHHVASTFDGKTLTVFVDGKKEGSSAAAKKPFAAEHAPMMVGNDPGYLANQLKGAVSDVRIYNRPLNSEEIATLISASQ